VCSPSGIRQCSQYKTGDSRQFPARSGLGGSYRPATVRANSAAAATLELAAIPLLAESWRATLARRGEKILPDPEQRLIGENG
jgi:hypothetical protein